MSGLLIWVKNKQFPFIQSKAAYFMNPLETVGGQQGKMWFQDVAKKQTKQHSVIALTDLTL